MLTNPTSLWATFIISTYASNNAINKNFFIWKSIKKGWELCSKGIAWPPHILSNINIWEANWIPGVGNLRATVGGPLQISEKLLN